MNIQRPTVEQIAKMFGCTPDRVRSQFLANAQATAKMHAKAARTGRKVNGYTAEQLNATTFDCFAKAQA